MCQFRYAASSIVLVLSALTALPVEAAFHEWYIKEIYSNQSGSVQFIELFTPSSGQQVTNGQKITSGSNTFTFNANTATPTNNKHLLLATASFVALAGAVPPNFATIPLPANFFSTAGDTINFVGADSKTFGAIPSGNVNSRNYTGPGAVAATIRVNSPTNFAGDAGSINRGDYNGDGVVDAADYLVYRDTLGQAASPAGVGADGNTNGMIDEGDYALWTARFGNVLVGGAGSGSAAGQGSVTPEPSTIVLFLIACAVTLRFVRRLHVP